MAMGKLADKRKADRQAARREQRRLGGPTPPARPFGLVKKTKAERKAERQASRRQKNQRSQQRQLGGTTPPAGRIDPGYRDPNFQDRRDSSRPDRRGTGRVDPNYPGGKR